MEPVYYTVAAAARVLVCSPATVRRLIGEGRLSTVDLSAENAKRRAHRIPAEALANLNVADLAPAGRHLEIVPKRAVA